MLSFISVIGAVFWIFVNSATAIDDDETIVTRFAKTYHDFLNFDTAAALAGNSDYRFILNELQERLLPIGELVRIMPDMAMRMSEEDNQNRALCQQLTAVLDAYKADIVAHEFSSNVSTEYDTKILPALYELFEALKNEAKLVPEHAGNFVALCERYRPSDIFDKFDRIFRENCGIDCQPYPLRKRHGSQPELTDCILETLASDYTFEKIDVTRRVQQYGRDLVTLLMMMIFCDYSTAEDFQSDNEFEGVVSSHVVEITKITHHVVEYVNWKMARAWPNVSGEFARIALDIYAKKYVSLTREGYSKAARMIQSQLDNIGDYRHTYQVLVSNMDSQRFISIDPHDVIHQKGKLGVDCLIVRHEAGHGWTKHAEKAHHEIGAKIVPYLETSRTCRFRSANISTDLEELSTSVNLTIPSDRTYRTVVVEHGQTPSSDMPDNLAHSSENSYWSVSERYSILWECLPYRLTFLL